MMIYFLILLYFQIGFKNTMHFLKKQVKLNNFQFCKFQHELFGAIVVKMDGGLFVGACSIHGEDGAFSEFLVLYAEAFLDKVGVGGFERLSRGVKRGL